ncbi:GIN domain-containing protein [Aquimarina spongiae]|uniref:Putative auto-transporter adhesin, head GIN domain n=1 Tax=Aquimarina spongiae TaxID=570521 RepID=A0A1M6CSX5_9FLAO|nr:DUF2807 domain-containing protein [Aquimarina spongiae]SHI63838.1 Putative auto-transporter adhesin, head GIN domain [Aquimarina spongiae]
MKKLFFLCCICSLTFSAYAQKEKIKGNKIVSTERYDVEPFHTIEIYESFEVTLDESSDSQVKIEADSNIQRVIQIEVVDSVLTIKSDKDLRRAKALNIDILYGAELKKIVLYDKVNAKSLSAIKSSGLTVEVNDYAEVFLTTETGNLSCVSYGKSRAELHASATSIVYQVNENSEVKGIVTADKFKIDLYQKATAELEGEVQFMQLRTDNETDFYGTKLNATKASLLTEGSSDNYVQIQEEITIEAKDKSEIFLLGEPKISIQGFTNEAALFKKNIDYTPSKLRLN